MNNATNYLILSYGRSGSVLLAERLGRVIGALAYYVKKIDGLTATPVQHSHLMFELVPAHFQRLFSLRSDPVETIMSMLLVNHYRTYHKFSDQIVTVEPFIFEKWELITKLCRLYQLWHQYYGQRLASADTVIFYEDLVKNLTDINRVYHPIYTNKKSLILNYDQVLDCINQYRSQLEDSQRAFVTHTNTVDIYKLLTSD
jgi:hypothetical protein